MQAQEAASTDRDWIQALRPSGIWKGNEGTGDRLKDHSGNNHDGLVQFVSWDKGMLNFRGGNWYEWLQIPTSPTLQSETFSIGAWVYSRRDHYDRHGMFLIGQQFHWSNENYRWGGIGNALRIPQEGLIIHLGGSKTESSGLFVGVISSGKRDAIGSLEEEISINPNEWQHILYTFEDNTASLFINGEYVLSANEVPFSPSEFPFVVGSDFGAWGVWPRGVYQLDGSIQNIVFFDRALSHDEVSQLTKASRPSIDPAAVATFSGSNQSHPTISEILETVTNPHLPDDKRAEAVLELASMRSDASEALPVLLELLDGIQWNKEWHLPRIEDFFRNALIRAVLDIAPGNHREAREALGYALAKPALSRLNLSQAHLAEVREKMSQGDYMDAMETFRNSRRSLPRLPGHLHWGFADPDSIRSHLPLKPEYFDEFLSKGNPFSDGPYSLPGKRPADYTPVDVFRDYTFMTVVERLSLEEVTQIFDRSLRNLTEETPDPEAKWSRVKILMIDPEGLESETLLGGDWLIFDARDAKNDGWAIALDSLGYIHLVGGQHNSPRQHDWIPGSWEKLGLGRGNNAPQILYWVSERPKDITSMRFRGKRSDPRRIPAENLNYMNFVRSPDQTLFLFGREHIWSYGLFRYNARNQQWEGIRGNPQSMFDRAREENPGWARFMEPVNATWGPTTRNVFALAWQPSAYNFNRSSWGVRFDATGRMHIQFAIRGVGEGGQIVDGPMYAFSDDHGQTFRRADGSELQLPLTVNPIPDHNADNSLMSGQKRFSLWRSLIRETGYADRKSVV